jgi:hypothetical protein
MGTNPDRLWQRDLAITLQSYHTTSVPPVQERTAGLAATLGGHTVMFEWIEEPGSSRGNGRCFECSEIPQPEGAEVLQCPIAPILMTDGPERSSTFPCRSSAGNE